MTIVIRVWFIAFALFVTVWFIFGKGWQKARRLESNANEEHLIQWQYCSRAESEGYETIKHSTYFSFLFVCFFFFQTWNQTTIRHSDKTFGASLRDYFKVSSKRETLFFPDFWLTRKKKEENDRTCYKIKTFFYEVNH